MKTKHVILIVILLVLAGASARFAYLKYQADRQAKLDECHDMYFKIINMRASPEYKGYLWQMVDAVCEDL